LKSPVSSFEKTTVPWLRLHRVLLGVEISRLLFREDDLLRIPLSRSPSNSLKSPVSSFEKTTEGESPGVYAHLVEISRLLFREDDAPCFQNLLSFLTLKSPVSSFEKTTALAQKLVFLGSWSTVFEHP